MTILKLIRLDQWIKNGFVWLPLFFSGNLFCLEKDFDCLIVFFSFCLVASGIYCVNDIVDRDKDRRHPVKCHRPVANGSVSVRTASLFAALFFLFGLGIVAFSSIDQKPIVVMTLSVYLLLNILYCFWLKNLAIVDVAIIAIGYVLRVIAGALCIGVWISDWIVIMTFLLTLFIALAKRRDDVLIDQKGECLVRKSLKGYSIAFIDLSIGVVVSVMLVSYIMYTISPEVVNRMGSDKLYITSIFVLLGLLRYLQVAIIDKGGGSPTKVVLHDVFIQVCIACWAFLFLFFIYIK